MMLSSITDTTTTTCVNCGKAESNDLTLKRCTACKLVRYCSRDCQIAHRPNHKKACKKRAAELFDEELFKDPPERSECPICMLPLPFKEGHVVFKTCCGKKICLGCVHAQIKEERRKGKREFEACAVCAFCRTHDSITFKKVVEQLNRGVERNDPSSIEHLATFYMNGKVEIQKDEAKAIELFQKAAELGCAESYFWLGHIYNRGVKKDIKTARHYFELGVIGGSIYARHKLADLDWQEGKFRRACKHYLICVKAGFEPSLNEVKNGFMNDYVSKDEYEEALRAFQKQNEETRSVMRDEALVYIANPSLYGEKFSEMMQK